MLTALFYKNYDHFLRRYTLFFNLRSRPTTSLVFDCQQYCSHRPPDNLGQSSIGMSILNVAEKNDAAKHLAGFLSRGNLQRVSMLILNFSCFLLEEFLIVSGRGM